MDLIDWSILDRPNADVSYDAPSALPMNGRGVDTMATFHKFGSYVAPADEVRLPLGSLV
ncbi:hypothetical protein [Neoaquamicrobium sediminum]|uniref:hypothetical protein n=1 Tax=Neoaquamicrobium sediminum TaxID=1849104 RepID=UPI001566C8D3|nr:hypothetical protein [Mesorhizobium sediminum]NRC55166.1 hypothetical protein [Mesorhizobium sediminum]